MQVLTSWRSIRKAALLGGVATLIASQAGAAEPVRLGYTIHAGGFHVLDASIVLDLGRDGYTVEVNAQTQGILGTLFPWQTLARSDGRLNAGEASREPIARPGHGAARTARSVSTTTAAAACWRKFSLPMIRRNASRCRRN